MKIMIIVLLIIVLIVCALELFIAGFMAKLVVTPAPKFCPTPEQIKANKVNEVASDHAIFADADFEAYEQWKAEKFELENDGIKIPAVFHPLEHARGTVILAHGFGQNRYAMVPYAELFRSMGFSTLEFDERCFGESKASFGSLGMIEAKDIAALADWLKEKCGGEE